MTFAEFWPEYVRAHAHPATRVVHCVGTLAGWMTLGAALVLHLWWWIPLALAIPYLLAWISHFFIEHNKPASFERPLWSWWADQRMVALMLVGKMGDEVTRVSSELRRAGFQIHGDRPAQGMANGRPMPKQEKQN